MIPISVCIITKNEAGHLGKCLHALESYPFEIVVVDTGSTDNSKEIAAKYTNKIYDFAWIDDFSAARNFAADHASHNMILSLDTDEFITSLDLEQLQTLIEQNPKAVGSITLYNYFEGDTGKQCQICTVDRLYNRKYYRFHNPIHELLTPLGSFPYTLYSAPVEADHVGYLGTVGQLAGKAARNIEMLLKELAKNPCDPYLCFQLGQSYMQIRDQENALSYFQKAVDGRPNPENDYTRILVYNYGHLLLEQGMTEKASFLLSYYEHYNSNMNYLCLVGLYYLYQNQPIKALPEFVKALTAPERDTADSKEPSYYIGYIYELFGKKDIARTHYQNCGNDYAPAVEALKRLGETQ